MKQFDTVLVSSKTSVDAVSRLTSDPLIKGLRERGERAHIISPKQYSATDQNCDVAIFHYDDDAALDALRARKKPGIVACLGSDIYSLDMYLRSHEIADLYFAPTEAHCSMLRSQLVKPVYVLPEAADLTSPYVKRQRQAGKSVCWFGYPESFGKAMASLMPVIENCLQRGLIDRFAVITESSSMPANGRIEILPYSVEEFGFIVSHFDYVVLSHFALDLHVNSLIKSPNKLITSINHGLIPLASATPNYSAVLLRYNLGRFLFDSPMALLKILSNLDAERDSAEIREKSVRASFIQEWSPARTSEAFIAGLVRLGEAAEDSRVADIIPRQWYSKAAADKMPHKGFIRTFRDRVW